MPKQIIHYACDKCEKVHPTIELAVACEKLPEPPEGKELKEGDILTFQNEVIEEGITKEYKVENLSGTILHKKMNISTGFNSHIWTLMVGVEAHPEIAFCVIWIANGPNRTGWCSPGELKYPIQVIQQMKAQDVQDPAQKQTP